MHRIRINLRIRKQNKHNLHGSDWMPCYQHQRLYKSGIFTIFRNWRNNWIPKLYKPKLNLIKLKVRMYNQFRIASNQCR